MSCISAQAEVLIFSYAYNRPDFIEIQYKTLQKFFLDDYRLIVFNDAPGEDMAQKIFNVCAHYNIQCIRIPQEIHTQPYLPRLPRENCQHPTCRNCNVVQYSLNNVGFDHDDIVMLLDSDMFLIKPFSVREFLNGYDLGGFKPFWAEFEYLWIGLVFLDMKTLPNKRTLTFNCGEIDGIPVDAGGHSHFYLKNNPEANLHVLDHFYSEDLHCASCKHTDQPVCTHNTEMLRSVGLDTDFIDFIQAANRVEFYHHASFLHYRSGTNWNHQSAHYHQMKTDALNRYIASIME